RVGAPRRAPHAVSPVLGRRNNTDWLALAATPDGELQSPRRRPRPPSDRRGAQLRLHRHLPFQPRVQKTVRLLTAHTGAPIVPRWQPEATALRYDVLNFAVDEMNAAGGLLGREIKVVSFDTQTNMQLYAQYAQEAALKNKVAVLHGGITSASREVIRPVLDKYKTLYFYDMPYEGGVCDRNIFIDGLTPAHNTEVLVGHGMKNWGKKVYTLAADYNYGQITADWVKKYVKDGGGEVLGTEYFPLDA